jgi:hypothetical protein
MMMSCDVYENTVEVIALHAHTRHVSQDAEETTTTTAGRRPNPTQTRTQTLTQTLT